MIKSSGLPPTTGCYAPGKIVNLAAPAKSLRGAGQTFIILNLAGDEVISYVTLLMRLLLSFRQKSTKTCRMKSHCSAFRFLRRKLLVLQEQPTNDAATTETPLPSSRLLQGFVSGSCFFIGI